MKIERKAAATIMSMTTNRAEVAEQSQTMKSKRFSKKTMRTTNPSTFLKGPMPVGS